MTEPVQDEKGLSARQLVVVFLAGVAVCGVFFSLGYLVGYNERTSKTTPLVEHVTSPPVIPSTANPPLENAPAATRTTPVAPAPAGATTGVTDQNITEPPEQPKPSVPAAGSAAPAPASLAPAAQPDTVSRPAAVPQGGEVTTGFTVQVAASRAKEDAEALVKILKARDYPVFIVAPEYAHANDNLFRVQVGPFTSRDDAEKVRTKLMKEGFKRPFIR